MGALAEGLRERAAFLVAHVREHHLRTFRVQLLPDARAQSARRAGDDGNLAGQTCHGTPSGCVALT